MALKQPPFRSLFIAIILPACLRLGKTTTISLNATSTQSIKSNATVVSTPRPSQPFLECYWPKQYNLSKIEPTFLVQYRNSTLPGWTFNLTCENDTSELVAEMQQKGMIKKRVLFVIHGYKSNIGAKWLYEMSESLLAAADDTVILVGWGKGADFRIDYPQAASNTRTVSAALAIIAKKLREISSVYLYCIGHSLGAHICGQAGATIEFDRITGLDPAGPQFFHCPRNPGLNNGSAACVDVIHTNGESHDGLGRLDPLGHIDFYPSCGRVQPGCKRTEITCSHHKAIVYFIQTIKARPEMVPAAQGTCGTLFELNCKPCTDETCPPQPWCKGRLQAVGYWSACSENKVPMCGEGSREFSYGKWFVPVTKQGFALQCTSP